MTNEANPTFFLTTAGEYKLLSKPRACWSVRRLRDLNRDDYMLVNIDPPLVGQSFGLGGRDITSLVLSARLQGFSLFPVKKWPMDVYVTRIIEPQMLDGDSFNSDQVELIAWGMVFNDPSAAEMHAHQFASELI